MKKDKEEQQYQKNELVKNLFNQHQLLQSYISKQSQESANPIKTNSKIFDFKSLLQKRSYIQNNENQLAHKKDINSQLEENSLSLFNSHNQSNNLNQQSLTLSEQKQNQFQDQLQMLKNQLNLSGAQKFENLQSLNWKQNLGVLLMQYKNQQQTQIEKRRIEKFNNIVQNYAPNDEVLTEKTSDPARQENIAQTRYMDKQKVSNIYFEPAREQSGCLSNIDVPCNNSQNNFENQSIQSLFNLINDQTELKDLKNSIISKIPTIYWHVQNCKSQNSSCQINRELLSYFLKNEMQTKNLEENTKKQMSRENSLNQLFDQTTNDEQTDLNKQESDQCSQNGFEKAQNEDLEIQRSSVMLVTKCPHVNRKHYAKNMCSSCYRKFGRNQNASKCGHNDRLLYSMGMCQTCYLSDYHKRKTKIKRKELAALKQSSKNARATHDPITECQAHQSFINPQFNIPSFLADS